MYISKKIQQNKTHLFYVISPWTSQIHTHFILPAGRAGQTLLYDTLLENNGASLWRI